MWRGLRCVVCGVWCVVAGWGSMRCLDSYAESGARRAPSSFTESGLSTPGSVSLGFPPPFVPRPSGVQVARRSLASPLLESSTTRSLLFGSCPSEPRGARMPSHRGRSAVVVALRAFRCPGGLRRTPIHDPDRPACGPGHRQRRADRDHPGLQELHLLRGSVFPDHQGRLSRPRMWWRSSRLPGTTTNMTEFFTENLNPYIFRDEVELNYRLQPASRPS